MEIWQENFKNRIPSIMGIINVTTDSFFDGGKYISEDNIKPRVDEFIENSVEIIDVGGESSRPGALPVSQHEELDRVIKAINIIKKMCSIPISVDTYKPEVAKAAIDNGAQIINDITGLTNFDMVKLAADTGCYVIIMHKYGEPKTMQINPLDIDRINIVKKFLDNRIKNAINSGIKADKILIDPGIGFGKTLNLNIELIKKTKDFAKSGFPVVLGVSRKSLIGQILNAPAEKRLTGSICMQLIGVLNGAHIIRTHDIKETRDMISIYKNFYGG